MARIKRRKWPARLAAAFVGIATTGAFFAALAGGSQNTAQAVTTTSHFHNSQWLVPSTSQDVGTDSGNYSPSISNSAQQPSFTTRGS